MKNIWQILGIVETADEHAIRKAYMTALPANNPEDNPEGFDRLRRAYEQALEAAVQKACPPDADGPVGKFIKRAEELYANYHARTEPENWWALLQDEACQRLDLEDETSIRLLIFLLNNFVLPREVWRLLAEHFDWPSKEAIIRRHFPPDFYGFILRACEEDVDIAAVEIITAIEDCDWDKARALLMEKLDKDPYDESALAMFEEVSYKLIEQLEQHGAADIFKLAKIYLNVQEYEICKKLLESAQPDEPDRPDGPENHALFHRLLGDCYTGLSDYRAAVYHYRQSLDYREELAVYVKLTNVLLELGKFDEVIHFAESGQSLQEQNGGQNEVAAAFLLANNALAHAGLAERMRGQALALIDRAIDLRPNIAHFYEQRAEILEAANIPHSARKF